MKGTDLATLARNAEVKKRNDLIERAARAGVIVRPAPGWGAIHKVVIDLEALARVLDRLSYVPTDLATEKGTS